MASGGGGNWIGGLVGGISAGAGVRGYNNAVNSANKWYEQMYSPTNVNNYAQQYNPWTWDAIAGKYGTGGTNFQRDMYNIAQGKDISPWLLNNPLNQINQGQSQNLARMQSIIGRNASGGGLANAYALANLGGANTSRANLMNNYGQWREQQRRSDLNWLLGQVKDSQNRGQVTVNNIAGSHGFKKNFWQKLSAFGAGYASGEGGTQAPMAPQVGNGYNPNQGTQDSWGNIPNSNNSMTGYQDAYTYPYQTGSSLPAASDSNNPYASSGSKSSIQTGSNPTWYSWK